MMPERPNSGKPTPGKFMIGLVVVVMLAAAATVAALSWLGVPPVVMVPVALACAAAAHVALRRRP